MAEFERHFSLPESCADSATGQEFFLQYTRHAKQLYRYIRTLVHNQADAEDAFQEVSATLWQKFNQFEPGTNFLAWSLQMARYSVFNQRQRQRRSGLQLSDEVFAAIANECTEMQDLLERQHRALADCYQLLSSEHKLLIDQRYQSEASMKDLAVRVNRPLRAVYRLMDRIHSNLLNCIQRKLESGNP